MGAVTADRDARPHFKRSFRKFAGARATGKHLETTKAAVLLDQLSKHYGEDARLTYPEFCQVLGTREAAFAAALFAEVAADGGDTVSLDATASMLALCAHGSRAALLELIFAACDADGSGALEEAEVGEMLATACADNNVRLEAADVAELARSVMRAAGCDAGGGGGGVMSLPQFLALVEAHPRFLQALRLQGWADAGARRLRPARRGPLSAAAAAAQWVVTAAGAYWREALFASVLLACAAATAYWLLQSLITQPELLTAAGGTLGTARTAAAVIVVLAFCLLPPVTVALVDALRTTPLRHVANLDTATAVHSGLGVAILACAVIHAVCWLVAYANLAGSADWVAAAPPLDGASFGANARSFAALCSTSTSITGFVMLATLLAGTPFAMKYPRSWAVVKRSRVGRALNNYTAFWNTHVVMAVVFFGLILVHPLPGLPSASPGGPSVAWVLLSLPILLYLGSAAATLRRRRAAPPARVVDAELHPGGVLALRLERPALGAGAVAGAGPMQFRAGQYVRLACPELSRLEWHPFTISSAPSDPGLTLHIKALGDWTGELHARFRAVIEARGGGGGGGAQSDAPGKSDEGDGEGGADPARWPTIWVDGPWGSPVQAFEEFPVLVLVAAGIGVTPMASVLAELLRRAEGAEGAGALSARKVYFRWLVRQQQAPLWFQGLLQQLGAEDHKDLFDLGIHYTGGGSAREVRTLLLQLAQDVAHAEGAGDFVAGAAAHKVIAHFGRPDWEEIFEGLVRAHPGVKRIGVFFCGSKYLRRELARQCFRFSAQSDVKFVFRPEVF